ncbi:hypothetical protein IMCC12053_1093 [Celeribacter marinus]|uniref:Uncharacterized protein n=1 Tax=Celeribacter marinus TaxID=1397108 RepID=A0A0N9ZGW3_9RHOB|nr:hypothetical protein IMCC12053_1093 [Celeribacter marinus]
MFFVREPSHALLNVICARSDVAGRGARYPLLRRSCAQDAPV